MIVEDEVEWILMSAEQALSIGLRNAVNSSPP
jgi:hypothetical protein